MYPSSSLLMLFYIFVFILWNAKCQVYYKLELQRTKGGQYYSTIYIGNPPQPQSVIIDNTQTILLLNCQGCLGCKQSERYPSYQSSQSFSSKKVECKDKLSICNRECKGKKQNQQCQANFQDYFGKYNFKIISDDILLHPDSKTNKIKANFGCIQNEAVYNVHYQNGILGLANSQLNIFTKLLETEDKKPFKQLGFCFAEKSGYFEIGTIPKPDQNAISFTMHSSNYYAIAQVKDIKFGNQSFKQDNFINDTGLLIMTRQPFTIFPTTPYNLVMKQIKLICQQGSQCNITYIYNQRYRRNLTCLSFAEQDIDLNILFPNIQFLFQKQVLTWQPIQFMKKYQQNTTQLTNHFCLEFTNSSKIKKYALGLSFLQNKRIIFDILASSIYVQQNYNCAWQRIQKRSSIVQYLFYCIIFVFLIFRNLIVRLGKKYIKFTKKDFDNKAQQIEDKSTASIK